MQRIFIIGNLTLDPQMRTSTNGTNMCSFTVAVDRRRPDRNGQKQTDYFRVSTMNKQAENCQKFLSKGKKVFVAGELQARAYDKDGTTRISLDISADEVEFLSPRGESPERNDLPKSDVNGFVVEDVDSLDLPF